MVEALPGQALYLICLSSPCKPCPCHRGPRTGGTLTPCRSCWKHLLAWLLGCNFCLFSCVCLAEVGGPGGVWKGMCMTSHMSNDLGFLCCDLILFSSLLITLEGPWCLLRTVAGRSAWSRGGECPSDTASVCSELLPLYALSTRHHTNHLRTCIHRCTCVCMCQWRPEVDVFLNCSLLQVLKQGLSLKLDLMNSARLTCLGMSSDCPVSLS